MFLLLIYIFINWIQPRKLTDEANVMGDDTKDILPIEIKMEIYYKDKGKDLRGSLLV